MRSLSLPALLTCAILLTGCDLLGIEDPAKVAAMREADGRAVGAACRHAGRAIEDCYTLNARSQKAAIFAGWKDMNDYMRENKIDAVAPQLAEDDKGRVRSARTEGAVEESDAQAHGDEAKQSKASARNAKHG